MYWGYLFRRKFFVYLEIFYEIGCLSLGEEVVVVGILIFNLFGCFIVEVWWLNVSGWYDYFWFYFLELCFIGVVVLVVLNNFVEVV